MLPIVCLQETYQNPASGSCSYIVIPRGWGFTRNLVNGTDRPGKDTDRPSAGWSTDLKQRGFYWMEPFVIWGEIWPHQLRQVNWIRKIYIYMADHHPNVTVFMAGGGIKPCITYGETDEFGYNIVEIRYLNQWFSCHTTVTWWAGSRKNLLNMWEGVIDPLRVAKCWVVLLPKYLIEWSHCPN